MSLCFYIIYTPNTVKPLQLLLYSLLKWSDCSFCLVANGCHVDEQRALQQLCAKHLRLSYRALPTHQMMLHGDVLNLLQAQNQDDYFCFMDSDIYAVAEFMPDFLPLLGRYCGVFSGMPLRYPQSGLTLPPGKAFWAGPYTHAPTGLCVGATFFAIYDNHVIDEIRHATGIGFNKYHWKAIPTAYQAQLEALGLRYELYDTAKVLNLVLHLNGYPLCQQTCPTLRHIEAVSRFMVIQQQGWWRQIRTWGGRWIRHWIGQKKEQTYAEILPYLSKVLWALANNQPVPQLPAIAAEPAHAWMLQAMEELLALHAESAR